MNVGSLETADKLAAAFIAVFVAGGGLAKASGGPTWLAIAFGVVGVVGAVLGLVLKTLYERAKRRDEQAALLAS